MSLTEELSASVARLSVELQHLTDLLAKPYDLAPDTFPKPLDQMGASDKLKMANSLIDLADICRSEKS